MKEHKKYLSIFAALLLAVFAIVCVFGVACKGNKEEDEPVPSPDVTVEHTHDYEASWDWGTDYTTCDVTLTCTSKEGECDVPTVTGKATVTSADTTDATCEGEGIKTYTATYEYDGKTYTGNETETLPALGHAWPAADSTKNVDWQWGARTDKVVSIVVTCERCGTTLLDEEVEYDTDSTSGTTDILSAEYEVDETLTYTSEYDMVNDPEEHAHHYEPTAWNWSDDYTTCTVTLACGSVVGECPEYEKTITKDAEVTSEETTPATCEEDGEMTYTATLVYGGHTYTDTKTEAIEALGHDYDAANATWEWTVDSEGKATATVTIACSRDSSHTAWSNTQTDIEIGTDGLYHASITGPDGVTPLTDDYELVEVQNEYHIDFSDSDTYEWIGTPASAGDTQYGEFLYLDITEAKEYTNGVLTFKSISGQSINKENDGSLFTSKATSDGTYFMIDLSAFEGSYVSISAVFIANGSGDRSMYVTTSASTSSWLEKKTSSDRENNITLTYSRLISAGDVLYLTWDNNIRIFTIDIEIVDEDPDYCHCGAPSYPGESDTEHVVWDWENRDEDNQNVNVTIFCTECGKMIVSEDTQYDVDTNDETKWYASVSEGNKTYESWYTIPQEGVPYEHDYEFSITELVSAMTTRLGQAPADKAEIKKEDFTGTNSFITLVQESTNNVYRTTSNGLMEIRDGGLAVMFKGTGTLTINVASTGARSGNVSSFALQDASGNYVEGIYTNGDTSGAQIISATNEHGTFYKVNYSSACTITFEITTPGTYTIVCNIDNSATATDFELDHLEVQNSSGSSVNDSVSEVAHSNRATRITAIVMKDTFADGESSESEGGSSSGEFEELEGDDEKEYELAIVGSTGTSQGNDPVVVTGEIGTVTIKYVDGGTTKGPSYKSDNKVSIEGTEYNPVKYESKDEITITVTTACTVTIVCRGKYTSATAGGGY